MHVRRFHERVRDCYDLVAKEVLVDVFFHGIVEYIIFLKKLSFPALSKSVESARRPPSQCIEPRGPIQSLNQVVSPWIDGHRGRDWQSRPLEKVGGQAFQFVQSLLNKNQLKKYLVLPPFPCGRKKATTFLEHWVKDQVICLLFVDFFPFPADQQDTNYFPYHQSKWLTLKLGEPSRCYPVKAQNG